MLRRGGGAIVNVASMVGLVGLKYGTPYSTAKGGLIQMTRAVALDYADKGIRVNCICPAGMTPTEATVDYTEQDFALMADAVLRNPLGRRATTDEQAQTLLFLVGPHSGHITGAIIATDGGYTAQ
jgi:NAD(P)-dependent dehydrogenase (short-subunit alcohol dehydrogenase family)